LVDAENPYNPLDKTNLGRSVSDALLRMNSRPMPRPKAPRSEGFQGAGVYAIYYLGTHALFPAYGPVAALNTEGQFAQPIYVGKAVPRGSRKAGIGLGASVGFSLFDRLREHAESIEQATNLDIRDFVCRYLVVDDIWIPLGESLLIRQSRPVWNLVLDGFGNHDPGGRRATQQRSPWDVVHPGRPWAEKLAGHPKDASTLISEIGAFLAGRQDVAMSIEEALVREDEA
jgi:hypothetical protein